MDGKRVYLIYVDGKQMFWSEDYFKFEAVRQVAIATAKLASVSFEDSCYIAYGVEIVRCDIKKVE